VVAFNPIPRNLRNRLHKTESEEKSNKTQPISGAIEDVRVRAARRPCVGRCRYLLSERAAPEGAAARHNMLYGSMSTWNSTPLGGFATASTFRNTSCSTALLSDCNWKWNR
jgi:hypothetical protein